MRTKSKIKFEVLYLVAVFAIMILITTVFMANKALKSYGEENISQTGMVYNIINKMSVPVVKEEKKIIRPYKTADIKIVKDYYDYRKTADEQINALIYYEDTYMQSTGIAYSNGDKFDVLAIFDGEVTDIQEDELIGNSITVSYGNMKSVYQSLSEINVAVGDKVKQGTILGVSGTSNINSNLGNHLYFEMYVDDLNVNPEEYYDKAL